MKFIRFFLGALRGGEALLLDPFPLFADIEPIEFSLFNESHFYLFRFVEASWR